MNTNNIKTHIIYKIKYDLKGHLRPQNVILKIQNNLFIRYIYDIRYFDKMKYDLKRHSRSHNLKDHLYAEIFLAHSFMD